MKLRCIFQILFLFLVMTSFASAQPPFQQGTSVEDGFDIEIFVKEDYRINETYDFHMHVFNKSNGVPITSGVTCYFHLYDVNGEHIITGQDDTTSNTFDYEVSINNANLTEDGKYHYVAQCNDSVGGLGGFTSSGFSVANANKSIQIPEAILYIIILVVMSLIFFVCLYLSLVIPYSNEYNNKNAIIKVTRKKYVKLSMILITYGMFVWLLNMILGLTENFISLPIYSGFIGFMFTAFNSLSWIISIGIIIVMIIEWIRDINLKKQLKDLGRATLDR